VVPIAHDSGGPREDIVLPEPAGPRHSSGSSGSGGGQQQRTGYRCSSLRQYADAIVEVLSMDQVERMRVAGAARRRASQFSDQRFQSEVLACLVDVLPLGRGRPLSNLMAGGRQE
jgi:alpha-1,2-mannosyltransferase